MRGKVRSACVFAALLGLAFLVGCSGGSDEKKVTGGTPTRPVPTVTLTPGPRPGDPVPPKPPPPQQAVSMTAKEYAEEYAKDKEATRAKYKTRPVELTGVVTRVRLAVGDEPFLMLEGAQGKVLREDVQCVTRDRAPWNKVMPGQTVKVRGLGPDFSVFAGLYDCEILEVSGSPPPTLTAEELAKEYAADPKAVAKKYDEKPLILSGEILKVDLNTAGAANITLKTANPKPRAYATFDALQKDRTKTLKPGQKIKVLGSGSAFEDGEEIGVHGDILIEAKP